MAPTVLASSTPAALPSIVSGASVPHPTAFQSIALPQFADFHRNLTGSYYNQLRPIPWLPDIFTVGYADGELVRAEGLVVFDKMMLDDLITSAVLSWIGAILTDARVIPGQDTKEAKHCAEFFTWNFKELPGGFLSKLFQLLYGAIYGFSVMPIQARIVTDADSKWAGCVAIKDLHYMMPHFLDPVFDTVDYMGSNASGALLGWNQVDRQRGTQQYFANDSVLHFVHHPMNDAARGRSLLLAADEHWRAKHLLMQLRNYNAEWVVGKLVVSQMPRGDDPNTPMLAVREFESRAVSIITGYLQNSGIIKYLGLDVAHLHVEGVALDKFDQILLFCNQSMLRSVGVPWLLSEDPQFGARALGEVQESSSAAKFEPLRQSLVGLIQKQLIDKFHKFNRWSSADTPQFTLAPAVQKNRQAAITLFLEAKKSGAVRDRSGDENYIREGLDAPLVKDSDAEKDVTSALKEAGPTGPQLAQVLAIVQVAANGAIPKDTATAMLAGLVGIPDDVVRSIMAPLANFKPAIDPAQQAGLLPGTAAGQLGPPQGGGGSPAKHSAAIDVQAAVMGASDSSAERFSASPYSDLDLTPPVEVQTEARRGLSLQRKLRRKVGWQAADTAHRLALGHRLSANKVRHIARFHAARTAEFNAAVHTMPEGSEALTFALWGSHPAARWSQRMCAKMDALVHQAKSD